MPAPVPFAGGLPGLTSAHSVPLSLALWVPAHSPLPTHSPGASALSQGMLGVKVIYPEQPCIAPFPALVAGAWLTCMSPTESHVGKEAFACCAALPLERRAATAPAALGVA